MILRNEKIMNSINEWERMVSGKLYNAASKDLYKNHTLGMIRCDRFNRIPLWRFIAKQKALTKLIPSSKGKDLYVFAPFYCEYGVNIKVGKGCFINYNCTFLDVSPITLEDGVWIGANVTLATPSHPFLPEERLPQEYPDGFHDLEYSKPITIKKNCWICSSATIVGGVTVGENSIVAAGAVVTNDVPPNSIVAGVPARVIRTIDEDDRMNVWETYMKNEMPLSIRDSK
jgi:maltose O-acetyltransferase